MAASNTMPALRVFDFADSLSVFHNPLQPKVSTPAPNLLDAVNFLKTLGFEVDTLADAQTAVNQAHDEAQANHTFDDSITAFEDYCALIKSSAIANNMLLHLRNAFLTEDEFKQLNAIKPLQLSASLEAPHIYVSHWQQKFKTSFKHLIIAK
jgi:hypothetical protein